MQPRFLVRARPASAEFQRTACRALATAIAAEADDQRVTQRIKDRQTERFR